MKTPLDFVFFLVAAICFGLAMLGVATPRINLMAAGLLAFTVPFLAAAWPA